MPEGHCVVALDTDAGLTGLGIGPGCALAQVPVIVDELLLGRDPRAVIGLWQRMMDGVSRRHHGGEALESVALLDLALWDLKARANEEPLWRTLGGLRPRVNVHAAARDGDMDDEALARWSAAFAREYGFRGVILRAGSDKDADLRRLALVQGELANSTTEASLMLDLGERLNPKDASRRVRALEECFDLTLVRDPARRHDAAGLKRVSNSIRAAVCGGGRLSSPQDYLAHFHAHALDVVELGVAAGGITGALQVADTAYAFELPILLADSPGNLHVHLAAAIPNCMSVEVSQPAAAGVLKGDVRIEDGWAIAGDRPGHGVIIGAEILAPPATKRRHRTEARA